MYNKRRRVMSFDKPLLILWVMISLAQLEELDVQGIAAWKLR
jgi:hypothetical protein